MLEGCQLTCPICGVQMRMIVFINEASTVRDFASYRQINAGTDNRPSAPPTILGSGRRFLTGGQRPPIGFAQREPVGPSSTGILNSIRVSFGDGHIALDLGLLVCSGQRTAVFLCQIDDFGRIAVWQTAQALL